MAKILFFKRAESEAFTSSILLYCGLLHDCTIPTPYFDPSGRTVRQIDYKIERWLCDFLGVKYYNLEAQL